MSESILRTRHSIRHFLDKPVDEALIREIIADAQRAPSWCNSQPAKAYVLTGEAAKKMVEIHHGNNVNGTKSWAEIEPPQMVPESWTAENWKNMEGFWEAADVAVSRECTDRLGFLESSNWDFHAPVIVYITISNLSTFYQAYDAGAFGYGICLSANEHGLGSIPAQEFVRFPQEIRDVLDIPENERLLMGIGIGYPDDTELNRLYEKNKRAPLDSILTIKSE